MTESAAQRTLTLPCSSCGRSRTECRTVDNPFLSCCTDCAQNDGNTHAPKPAPSAQYGVRFTDGSVWHPWNGRTQEQRAREALAELRAEYPRDADRLTLVVRSAADEPWRELTDD